MLSVHADGDFSCPVFTAAFDICHTLHIAIHTYVMQFRIYFFFKDWRGGLILLLLRMFFINVGLIAFWLALWYHKGWSDN